LQAARYLLTKTLLRNFVTDSINENWYQTESSNTTAKEPSNIEDTKLQPDLTKMTMKVFAALYAVVLNLTYNRTPTKVFNLKVMS
jgi:hypothetical protein